ncbi:hypothetical protein GCM10025777_17540 [Membranihabitans marinus]
MIALSSCDKSITIPLDPLVYTPHLMIYGIASPQSGALVNIEYNRPLSGLEDEVPNLPSLEVYLLVSGEKKYRFNEDSIGSFSLAPEEIDLKSTEGYSLWVRDLDLNVEYQSAIEKLPIQPNILDDEILSVSDSQKVFVQIILGEVDQPIEGYSIVTSLLDSNLVNLSSKSFRNKIRQMQIPDAVTWDEKPVTILINPEQYDMENEVVFYAPYVLIDVTYYSKGLALFSKDASQYLSSGEDIYQVVQPIYSNISGNHGVFGLYTEEEILVKLE